MALTLKTVNQFFCLTHRHMIIHDHTKFGKKKKSLSSSGDIEWTRSDTQAELQTDRRTDGQSDSNIHPPPPIFIWGGGRGVKIKMFVITMIFSHKSVSMNRGKLNKCYNLVRFDNDCICIIHKKMQHHSSFCHGHLEKPACWTFKTDNYKDLPC